MIKLFLHTILLILGFTLSIKSQTITWEDFKKETVQTEKYFSSNYTVDITYQSYKGKQTTSPFETMKGYVQKVGDKQSNYIGGIVTVTNNKLTVTIDSNNKLITLNNAPSNTNEFLTQQLDQAKSLVQTIKKEAVGGDISYEIAYNEHSPFSKAIIIFKSNYLIKQVILFYSQRKEYESENGEIKSDFATLKMTYSNYSKKKKYNTLSINQVITNVSSNPSLADAYKNFELIDFRPKN